MGSSNSKTGKGGYPVSNNNRLRPIARIILMGVYDDNCVLSHLRGIRYIVKQILELAIDINDWKPFIKMDYPYLKPVSYGHGSTRIHFPKPKHININMMPFIMKKDFESTKLPKYLKPYFDSLILNCFDVKWNSKADTTQFGKICFLTIQESWVKAGCTQRRPGLHVETPGNDFKVVDDEKTGTQKYIPLILNQGAGNITEHYEHPTGMLWGGGFYKKRFQGGIYMASSVADSCAGWHCKVVEYQRNNENDVHHASYYGRDIEYREHEVEEKDVTYRDVIGHLGDIEHLRSSLKELRHKIGPKMMMNANCIYWLTDRTPHEALPVKEKTYRQFFRLVTSDVSIWYKQHSTANPNGVEPDPKITYIIEGNKFSGKKQ